MARLFRPFLWSLSCLQRWESVRGSPCAVSQPKPGCGIRVAGAGCSGPRAGTTHHLVPFVETGSFHGPMASDLRALQRGEPREHQREAGAAGLQGTQSQGGALRVWQVGPGSTPPPGSGKPGRGSRPPSA